MMLGVTVGRLSDDPTALGGRARCCDKSVRRYRPMGSNRYRIVMQMIRVCRPDLHKAEDGKRGTYRDC